ncbi:MAG: hypothetical protein U0670_01585 [Anaerolineae bacterium]
MASEVELLRSGVAALQSGNREGAIQALSQVVDLNPYNEQAWFYLAAADTDPFMRKRYLERVLELNPNNAKARDILDKLIAKEQSVVVTRSTGPLTPPSTGPLITPPVQTPTPPPQPPAPAAPSPQSSSAPEYRPASLQARLNRTKSIDSPSTPVPPPPAAPVQPSEPEESPVFQSWDAPSSYSSSWNDPYSSYVNPDEYTSDKTLIFRDEVEEELPDPGSFAPLKRNSSARAAKIAASEGDEDLLSRISGTGEVPSAKPASQKVSVSSTIRPLAPDAGSLLGAAPGDSGFALPFDIPGAPARMSVGSILRGGLSLLRGSLRILTRRSQAYANEIERASWWRFLLYAVFVGLLQTLLLAFTLWNVDARITAALNAAGIQRIFNFASGFVMLLLGVPFYVACVMGGSAIGWLVLRQWLKVHVPYLKFLYAVSVVWLPLGLVASFFAFLFNILGFVPVGYYSLIAILASIAIAAYAGFNLYDAVQHFEGDVMMDEKERRRRRIAGASAVIGIFVMRLLLGFVLTAITGSTLLVFLFT